MNLVVAAVLGTVIAFFGSVPVAGPLAVLVLERAVSGRRREGLFVAFGGALAEAVVAFVVALLFPLLLLSPTVVMVSRIAGAAIVGTIGLVLLVHPEVVQRPPTARPGGSFLTGLVLSSANPTLVATWTVVVATLNSHGLLGRSAAAAAFFGLGVGIGVAGWFSVAVLVSGKAQDYVRGRRRTLVIRALGIILLCAGGYLLIRSIHEGTLPA